MVRSLAVEIRPINRASRHTAPAASGSPSTNTTASPSRCWARATTRTTITEPEPEPGEPGCRAVTTDGVPPNCATWRRETPSTSMSTVVAVAPVGQSLGSKGSGMLARSVGMRWVRVTDAGLRPLGIRWGRAHGTHTRPSGSRAESGQMQREAVGTRNPLPSNRAARRTLAGSPQSGRVSGDSAHGCTGTAKCPRRRGSGTGGHGRRSLVPPKRRRMPRRHLRTQPPVEFAEVGRSTTTTDPVTTPRSRRRVSASATASRRAANVDAVVGGATARSSGRPFA